MPDNKGQHSHHDSRELYEHYIQQCIQARTERLGRPYGVQVKKFYQFLATKTDWYTAPASTRHHLCIPGGLIIHSVGVCETAMSLRNLLMPEIPLDSVIFCSMYHDAGKVWNSCNQEGGLNPRYKVNVLAKGNVSDKVPFKFNVEDDNGISCTVKDAMLPLKFVDLSDAEIQALLLADGQYVPVNKHTAHKEHPLSLICHYADYWNGHVLEGGITADWLSGMFRTVGD